MDLMKAIGFTGFGRPQRASAVKPWSVYRCARCGCKRKSHFDGRLAGERGQRGRCRARFKNGRGVVVRCTCKLFDHGAA